jgi:endonuclease/exonuclease/phosphatase family metal-dependent hydrolase
MSANLRNGGADPGALADLVHRVAPHAVLVQELTPEQARALAAVMPAGELAPARDHQGMGIALRMPGTVRRLPLPGRDALLTELAPDGLPRVELVNVHLIAPHVLPLWRTLTTRRGQVRGLLRHLGQGPRRARVLMGDLNATPVWPAYRRLVPRLTDAAVAAARGNGHRPQRTWGPWPGAPGLFRIDHALVSGLTVLALQVLDLPGSDHRAVVVDVGPPGPGVGDPG